MLSDCFWTLVFVLFIAGTYIAERFHNHSEKMKKMEKRIDQLEQNSISRSKP